MSDWGQHGAGLGGGRAGTLPSSPCPHQAPERTPASAELEAVPSASPAASDPIPITVPQANPQGDGRAMPVHVCGVSSRTGFTLAPKACVWAQVSARWTPAVTEH